MGRGKTGCADDSYAEVTWLRKAPTLVTGRRDKLPITFVGELSFWSIEIETRRLNAERPVSTHPRSLTVVPRMTGNGADLPLRGRSTNAEDCPLAVIRALAACTFKTRALTDFALFNHLIRAGAAVAGYAGPEAADFPVKLVLGYIGID
jgi:hypothetical protein